MKKAIIFSTLCASLLLLNACGYPSSPATDTETTAPETSSVNEEETTVTVSSAETTAETTAEGTATEAATSETTAEGTTAEIEEMNGAPNSDFVSIAGDWYIDGDITAASLHINADGTYKAYYPIGILESEGTIRYEPEEIENTTIYHYNLYDMNGEYFTGFVDDGSEVKTDIYMGNGAEPHYQKFGVGGLADDGRGPGEEFVGSWICDRVRLEITQLSDTEFHALVSWSDSAYAHVEWDYPLTYQNGKLVCDENCTKTYVEYASADAEPNQKIEYTDGSGEFAMQGAGVIWNDLKEHSGDGLVFSSTPTE